MKRNRHIACGSTGWHVPTSRDPERLVCLHCGEEGARRLEDPCITIAWSPELRCKVLGVLLPPGILVLLGLAAMLVRCAA